MNTFVILLVAGTLLILLMAVLRLDYQIKRIVLFQRRRLGRRRVGSVLSDLQRRATKKYHTSLSDVRDLVISLQLGTSLEATLTGSLARAAEQFSERGDLGERLRRHVESRLSISPQAVLEGLADDFDIQQLDEVLERVRMAEEGGISYNRVLTVSADAIEEDIRGQIEEEIEKAPIRMTLPMIAGVFFPALILGLVPLLASGLSQMNVAGP
jgi:tight adherence protein C